MSDLDKEMIRTLLDEFGVNEIIAEIATELRARATTQGDLDYIKALREFVAQRPDDLEELSAVD